VHRPIIACVIVALVAGATSATAANLITGDDIKDGSITAADIKNPTIDNEDIKKGAIIKKKLSKAVRDALDEKGAPGPQGATGPQGPQGPTGPQGPAGTPAAAPEYGVVTVFVDRGNGPSRFATYSAELGSPAGTTAGGDFRFTCTPAQAPCKISYGAAVISNQSGNAVIHPRLLIHKQADLANAPITFCEYADGANNNAGLAQIPRVPTLAAAVTATQTPLSMGIGGSFDCGASQPDPPPPPTGVVEEIWVPAASAVDNAFYDVAATFTFGQRPQ
jgi:hypothetical protein